MYTILRNEVHLEVLTVGSPLQTSLQGMPSAWRSVACVVSLGRLPII